MEKKILLAKTILDKVQVIISKAWIDSYIIYDDFLLVNKFLVNFLVNVHKRIWRSEMKNRIFKNFIRSSNSATCRKNKESSSPKVVNKKKKKKLFHQNVQCLAVKKQDLLNTKK